MSSQNKNKKSRSGHSVRKVMEQDRISDLPECVLDEILMRLPIKDMVMTSVLSSKWRHIWASVPSLAIDDQSFPSIDRNSIINHILLLHLGTVHKFKLCCTKDKIPFVEMDRWIIFLSRHSIKELVFQITKPVSDYYSIPSCLYSCQGLTHLDLRNCSLSLPSKFKGFQNLKSLALESGVVIQNDLEELISSSPVLERLSITQVGGFDRLNVYGPNLLYFYIEGKFVDVCFKSASHLNEVYISTYEYNARFQRENPGEYGDLIKLMGGITQTSLLDLEGYFVEYMAAGIVPIELPEPCINLTRLGISVDFGDSNEVSVLLCFLRSAPNLKELQISMNFPNLNEVTSRNMWVWDANGWEWKFTHLQFVKICYISGTDQEMDFIKFMLLTSPNLKSLTVELDEYQTCAYYKMSKFEMLSFKRASVDAEINVRGWSESY